MAGMTEEQADKIIDLLEDILGELKDSNSELHEANSELSQHCICHWHD